MAMSLSVILYTNYNQAARSVHKQCYCVTISRSAKTADLVGDCGRRIVCFAGNTYLQKKSTSLIVFDCLVWFALALEHRIRLFSNSV